MSISVTWTGKSGQNYEFAVYSLATDFFAVGGVYILCGSVQAIDGTRLKALYVGETQSFEDRLNTNRLNHDGYKRAAKMGITHICARVVPQGATERLRIETDLRHALHPPCNAEPVPRVPPPLPKSLGTGLGPNARTLAELLKR
jgi:hypothetical protein